MIPDEQRIFLTEIRTGPGFIAWWEPSGTFRQQHFANEAEAASLIGAHQGEANIWCSMASFSGASKRSANCAEELKAFWFDVDAHGERYREPEECITALRAFLKATRLHRPTYLHMTGHGVQVFWVLPVPITRDEWQPVADALQELGERHQLGADPITADAARILRMPGTFNFRNPSKPRETVLHAVRPGHTDLAGFRSAIADALAKLPPKPVQRPKAASALLEDTSENTALIRDMLAAIDPDAAYPIWRDIVWAVAASGMRSAYDLARAWSERGVLWDERCFETVWGSYEPSREKGVGFGTLVHHARESGYAGPVPSGEKCEQLQFKQGTRSSPPKNGSLVTQRAADIEPEPIEWLVDGAIPLGMMVVIGGQPGMGKSQIALKLAAAVTTGKGLPDASNFSQIGSVVILANEDDAARTIRPRLDAAGADIRNVHIVEGISREGLKVDHFQLGTDVNALRQMAERLGDVRLIIIDPPSAYLGAKVDAYKESDVRRVLAPLSQLAHDTGALVLLVVHLNKRNDGGAQQRFGGSTAWIAAPRAAFLVAEEETTRRRFLLPVKNNLGNDRLGFEYRVAEKLLNYDCGPIKAPHIEWLGKSERPASELLNPPKNNGPGALDEAKEFLRQTLANGAQPAAEVEAAAEAVGMSRASLIRAKKEMRIASKRVGNAWIWKLGSIFDDQVD